MSEEVVKHHNDLNTVPMRNWSSEEMNFFFGILSKLKNQGTTVIEFSGDELKELAEYSDWNLPRFKRIIENLGEHIASIRYFEKTSYSFKVMNLFSVFEVSWNNDMSDLKARIGVTENYEYIVNKLNAEFTYYELAEFTSIRSTYAKTMYRILKQWKVIGKKEFAIDHFKQLLDMPEYYKPSHIDKNVIEPIKKELPTYFENLKIKKIKSNKRGNPVIAYKFTWLPEKTEKWDPTKYNYRNNQRHAIEPDWLKNEYQNSSENNNDETQKKIDEFKKKLEEYRNG